MISKIIQLFSFQWFTTRGVKTKLKKEKLIGKLISSFLIIISTNFIWFSNDSDKVKQVQKLIEASKCN